MNIGNRILSLRKEKKLSQEELGELINVTRQTISNWELGETNPDMNQLKMLSKTFNISIDELVDNDLKNVIVEKVSNTEKLAGLVIKILKIIGVIIIVYIVLIVIAFLLFTFYRKEVSHSEMKSFTLNCAIENNDYNISVGENNYYVCDNCTKEMNVYIKDITDWANIEHSKENIERYFSENGGNCKE